MLLKDKCGTSRKSDGRSERLVTLKELTVNGGAMDLSERVILLSDRLLTKDSDQEQTPTLCLALTAGTIIMYVSYFVPLQERIEETLPQC